MRHSCWFAVLALATATTAFAESLDTATLKRVRAATFEVVVKKPTTDSLSYERPLPLDKLPYAERTDAYVSIGTAFAIGKNRYITAAHVMAPGAKSQFGEPALRDASGVVYSIAEVLKYSNTKDFIELSLKQPAEVEPLAVNQQAQLNEPVFAVGNALGEGVVVRDGLLTSETPEDRHGEWKWLRFSAAASPGSSGGPLLDKSGQVLGVILRKSPNENLNYAAPIGLVLSAPTDTAKLRFEGRFRIPVIDVEESDEELVEIPLPSSFAALAQAERQRIESFSARGRGELQRKHADSIFPQGAGSEMLLAAPPRFGDGLGLMCRQTDGTWNVFVAQNPQTVQLEQNGWISHGGLFNVTFAKFRRPDNVAPEVFYNDSKYYGDTFIKAFGWKRYVGSEQVKVLSAGKAQQESKLVDAYGRVWQVRSWNVEYDDSMLMSVALPVPDGYLAMLHYTKTFSALPSLRDIELMASFAFPTYTGTVEQWRDYLARPAWLPSALADAKLAVSPSQGLSFKSKQLSLEIPAGFQKTLPESLVWLRMAYMREGSSIAWGVAGLTFAEKLGAGRILLVERFAKPAPSLPQPYALQWQKLYERAFPYNAAMTDMNGSSFIASTHPFPGRNSGVMAEPDVIYAVSVVAEGKQVEAEMADALGKLSQGLSFGVR